MKPATVFSRFLLVGATVVAAAWACTPNADRTAERSNVVLISLDTLRADHLGIYGYPKDTSPFLDSLSDRAVVFERAFAQYPSTLTSHMSMLTGLYPAEHAVYPPTATLSPDIKTLAEQLQAAGYATGGYTEGGYVRGGFGFRRGFDDFDARDRDGNEQLEKTFRRGVRFLERTIAEDRDKPFFLFLHTYAVHAPYAPPERYKEMFWPGPAPDDAFVPSPKNLVEANKTGRAQSEAALDYYRALYDAEIRYVDDTLRWFFEQLEALDLQHNTTVIITSDHGEEFRDHGKFNHEQLYDEILRVPLIVVQPEVSGRRTARMVELVDVTPTVLEIAGVESEEDLSGSSFARDLIQDSSYPKRMAYAETDGGRRSLYAALSDSSADDDVVQELVHLLQFSGKKLGATGNELELYSTTSDPAELLDLSASRTGIAEDLKLRLQGFMHRARAEADAGPMDEELVQRLKALGYLQ